MNLAAINGPDSMAATRASIFKGDVARELGGVLTHESDHGLLQRQHGMSTSAAQVFAGEISAYTAQATFHKALGVNSAQGVFLTYLPGGINHPVILREAQASVAIWCSRKRGGC